MRVLARGARGLRRALHSHLTIGLLLVVATVLVMFLASGVSPKGNPTAIPSTPHAPVTVFSVGGSHPAAAPATPAISLGAGASPAAICYSDTSSCSAGTGVSRITLTASATTQLKPYWPDVQVAFVVETTAFDGDFDHYNSYYGQDPCAMATSGQGPLCEESNGVPFFIQNAGSVATAIAAANPHSNVSFALVDFFGTDYDWNDGPGDSWKYNVDISSFVPASVFGGDVRSTFQANQMNEGSGWGCVCGLDDNFLHSSSITALYGTIIGSGLDWSLGTHHVIVLMGSAAPRDPGYRVNYWASSFDHCCTSPGEYGATCEPAYVFSGGTSPNCEGWVRSQDGNPDHSIAALTRTSPTCTDSIGGVCTVDVIDYWDTPTDPYSQGWPTSTGYPISNAVVGPGGSAVVANSANILLAGCDLAAATGGSWNGPAYWTCPNGQSGSLQYVPHGAIDKPNTYNPTLFSAIRQISFGPVYQAEVANGTGVPLFTWVPPANFGLAPVPAFSAACVTPNGYLLTCQTVPTVLRAGNLVYYGWNWSTNHSQNAIYVGDFWTASFNIINTGLPYSLDPVLACITISCKAAGSGAINGVYSSLTYTLPNSTGRIVQSFPLAQVNVVGPTFAGPPPSVPPPPPLFPPGIPIVIAPATPVLVPTVTAVGQGIGTVSLQAVGAGFLGAGFMRVGMKNRPVAMRVAAMNKKPDSKFDQESRASAGSGVGHFE